MNHNEPNELTLQKGIAGPRAPTPHTLKGGEQEEISVCRQQPLGTARASQCHLSAHPHRAMLAEEPTHG